MVFARFISYVATTHGGYCSAPATEVGRRQQNGGGTHEGFRASSERVYILQSLTITGSLQMMHKNAGQGATGATHPTVHTMAKQQKLADDAQAPRALSSTPQCIKTFPPKITQCQRISACPAATLTQARFCLPSSCTDTGQIHAPCSTS
eukprot:1156875-Pelagomonas_calceolata.AAC.7